MSWHMTSTPSLVASTSPSIKSAPSSMASCNEGGQLTNPVMQVEQTLVHCLDRVYTAWWPLSKKGRPDLE